jgi:hypothetical protein
MHPAKIAYTFFVIMDVGYRRIQYTPGTYRGICIILHRIFIPLSYNKLPENIPKIPLGFSCSYFSWATYKRTSQKSPVPCLPVRGVTFGCFG